MAQGVSGVGVAIATGGALLLYAAFTDQGPLAALRDVASGKPSGRLPVRQSSYSREGTSSGGGIVQAGYGGGAAGGPFPELVAAVMAYRGDIYSQGRRWQRGFSDCSSFVGKGLKALGLNPGISTTTSYLASRSWRQVPRASAGAGDIAVNTGHMVLFTGPSSAIGQQRPGRNVQTGSPEDLMSGTGSWIVLRYVGARPSAGGGGGSSARTLPAEV